MPELICLRSYLNRHQAEMDATFLQAYGIPTQIRADDAGGMQPHLLFGGRSARLMVPAELADEARDLLDSRSGDQPPDDQSI